MVPCLWRFFKESTTLSSAGTLSTKSCCSKAHPTWPRTLTGMGNPHLLWAALFQYLPHSKNVTLIFKVNLPSFKLKPLPLLLSLQALVKSLSYKSPSWGPPGDFSRLNNPCLFSLSSQDRCFGPRMRHQKWHPNPSCLLVRHWKVFHFHLKDVKTPITCTQWQMTHGTQRKETRLLEGKDTPPNIKPLVCSCSATSLTSAQWPFCAPHAISLFQKSWKNYMKRSKILKQFK